MLRIAFAGRRFATTPVRTWTRTLASEVDAIEASLQNSLKETHSIEALIQKESSEYIAPIDDETHAPVDYDADSVAYNYHEMKRIRARFTYIPSSIHELTNMQIQRVTQASLVQSSLPTTNLTPS